MERSELLHTTRAGDELVALASDGLSADEIIRLMHLRLRVREQRNDQPTAEMKRLAYARWLYHNGRVAG